MGEGGNIRAELRFGAGVLLVMTLLYETFIRQTPYAATLQVLFSLVIVVGVLLQSGGSSCAWPSEARAGRRRVPG